MSARDQCTRRLASSRIPFRFCLLCVSFGRALVPSPFLDSIRWPWTVLLASPCIAYCLLCYLSSFYTLFCLPLLFARVDLRSPLPRPRAFIPPFALRAGAFSSHPTTPACRPVPTWLLALHLLTSCSRVAACITITPTTRTPAIRFRTTTPPRRTAPHSHTHRNSYTPLTHQQSASPLRPRPPVRRAAHAPYPFPSFLARTALCLTAHAVISLSV